MHRPLAWIVGRERELGVARQFVKDTASHGRASLVFEGVAGIGKTAIWATVVQDARAEGVAVRVCRCSESDATWAFAGLGDLFEGLDSSVLSGLPLVLAVDDVQWLDTSSRSVLSFALRRLEDEPVRLSASCRTGVFADAVEHAAELYVRKGNAGFLLLLGGSQYIGSLPDLGLAQEKVLAAAVLGQL